MPILIIFAVVGIVYLAQKKVYAKYWNHNLEAKVTFTDRYMFEGEQTVLTETITNAKKLPLPWINVKFQIACNDDVIFYRNDMFSILFYQQITRKIPYTFPSRGVYSVKGIDLVSHNLFISDKLAETKHTGTTMLVYPRQIDAEEFRVPYEKMMGEIITRRALVEDPYMFKGIREYQPYDSFNKINFTATARAGEWMVNTQDPTVSQTIHILLNMEKGSAYYDEYLYEQSIRLAASIAAQYEEDGVPVSFYCNGEDYITHSDTNIPAGCGSSHIHSILGALASLNIKGKVDHPMREDLDQAFNNIDPDMLYVLISPYHSQPIRESYEALRSYTTAVMWILPVSSRDLSDPQFHAQEIADEAEDVYLWIN